ncbi:MAG: site-2 protease family protein [Candidatus Rokubacteria bacterium]|nr:site-2 protease family protein [Candidatus Rokubacteria bacterium]
MRPDTQRKSVFPGAWLRLGQVWGIAIGVHPSWLLVFALVTWSLAAGYFPGEHPGWSVRTYWLVAAVTSLLFFASIVVHELGHSRVALSHGLPIRSITLFVFGGIAKMTREPSAPEVELRVAAAGPGTSLVLAALFAIAAVAAGDLVLVAAPAAWLARINLTVALFNLVPAFPLDGGRVFRALLWKWTGSFDRATEVAGFAGTLVASGLIAFGIFTAFAGHTLAGIWMALIGWFLQSAAAQSQAQVGLKQLLSGVRVAQAMTRECPRAGRAWTLERLVREEVLGSGRRCFVITDDGHLAGLLTLHEIKAVPRERWGEVRVEDALTPADKVTTVGPDDELHTALEKMDDADVAQMPVVERGELVGMLGREQILHYIRTRAELGV